MVSTPLDRLRALCLALPGVADVPAWGTSTFRCPKIFAMYAQPSDQKHSGGRPGVWIKAAPGNQEFMVRDRPDRFYVPPYVGPSGWVGIYLDRGVDWTEVGLLVEEAWRLLAPKRTVKAHAAGEAVPGPIEGGSKAAKAKGTRSKAAATKPAKSKPAKSKPAKSKPARSKPVKSKPVKSKPAKSKPAKAKPKKAKPKKAKQSARATPSRGRRSR